MTSEAVSSFFYLYRQRCEEQLKQVLPKDNENPLHQAMRYATLNGGKRVRPILCYATAELLGCDAEHVDTIACAIELIHAYSLVHDDLPAMDDDDLRRGKPTCHIKFGEAHAILAGDALQALSTELLTKPDPGISPLLQLEIIQRLCQASGSNGMVGGQSLDLLSEGKHINLNELETIHRKKTGALLEASVTLPALACNAEQEALQHLTRFAQNLGLCFQVKDDILDVVGDTNTIGKAQGSDQNANKATYPAIMGLNAAKQFADTLHHNAINALKPFSEKSYRLREIADFILFRQH